MMSPQQSLGEDLEDFLIFLDHLWGETRGTPENLAKEFAVKQRLAVDMTGKEGDR